MSENCAFPNCNRIAQKDGLCIGHHIYKDSFPSAIIKEEMQKKEKQQKRIKPVSDKRKVLNRDLAKLVKKAKDNRPLCEMKVPGVCSFKTETIHHTKGRVGTLLLDEKYMMAACSNCNTWVENNHAEAVALGLKVSRLNK